MSELAMATPRGVIRSSAADAGRPNPTSPRRTTRARAPGRRGGAACHRSTARGPQATALVSRFHFGSFIPSTSRRAAHCSKARSTVHIPARPPRDSGATAVSRRRTGSMGARSGGADGRARRIREEAPGGARVIAFDEMTRRSRSGTPTRSPAVRRRVVSARSSSEGTGSPVGWLWPMMQADAFSRMRRR